MFNKEAIVERKDFYNTHLQQVVLPYWLPKWDDENGGFFTCYDLWGEKLLSKNKYVWSQGRCVWMYARLALAKAVKMPEEMRAQCRRRAEEGAEYLLRNCLLADGRSSAFVLSENNEPLEIYPGSGFSVSTFADCFIVIALAAAAELTGRKDYLAKAEEIFQNCVVKLKNNSFAIAPSVLHKGWRAHAPWMIMVNTADELAKSSYALREDARGAETDRILREIMTELGHSFIRDGIVLEYLPENAEPSDRLYGRYINPGHSNESMWFVLSAASRLGLKTFYPPALQVIRHTSAIAWDEAYGGMMYYLDKDGGKPCGTIPEEDQALARSLWRDWDNKLWWTHGETIYANLLAFYLSGDEHYQACYEKYHRYTFKTFPNKEGKAGEWIQLRKRDGTPNEGLIEGRLPVKDPYHLTRMLLLLIELLEKMEDSISA